MTTVQLTQKLDFPGWHDVHGIPSGLWDDPNCDFESYIEGRYNYADVEFHHPQALPYGVRAQARADTSLNRDMRDLNTDLRYVVTNGMLVFETYYTYSGASVDRFPAVAVLTPDELLVFGAPDWGLWADRTFTKDDYLRFNIAKLRLSLPLLMRHNLIMLGDNKYAFAEIYRSNRTANSSNRSATPVHLNRAGATLTRRLANAFPSMHSFLERGVFSARAFEVQPILDELTGMHKDLEFSHLMHRGKYARMNTTLIDLYGKINQTIQLNRGDDPPQILYDMIKQYSAEAASVAREDIRRFGRTRDTGYLSVLPK